MNFAGSIGIHLVIPRHRLSVPLDRDDVLVVRGVCGRVALRHDLLCDAVEQEVCCSWAAGGEIRGGSVWRVEDDNYIQIIYQFLRSDASSGRHAESNTEPDTRLAASTLRLHYLSFPPTKHSF